MLHNRGDDGHGVMSLSSHVGGGAAEATWPWHDVVAESCWRWRCRVNICCGVMSLPSHAGDGVAESTFVVA
jgi:hypothetical protein